jgi:ribosomal protein L31E
MFRRWLRSQCNLSTFEVDTGYIKRVARLSEHDFVQSYDRPRLPAILTDVVFKWKAMTEWNPARMVERFGDCIVKVAQGTQYGKRIHMTMAQYWHYAHNQRDEKPLYVFDPSFEKRMPELMEEFEIPRLFWTDYFSLLGNHRPNYRWLVMGPARSGTGFHIDPNGTSAWNALLCGRKRWIFYPPHVTYPPGVTVGLHPDGQLASFEAPDPLKWFYEIYPHLPANMRPVEVIQRAGDMLYVPAGWWHMVLNLEDTVSVTQNFVNKRNVCFTVRFLYRQGDLQMLHVWMDRMKEVNAKIWSRMNKKLKILDGTQARVATQFMSQELKGLKREKRHTERALKTEIRELKKKLGIEVSKEEEEKEDTSDDSDSDDEDDDSNDDEDGSNSNDSDDESSDSAEEY